MGFVLFRDHDHKYLSILLGRPILIKTDFLKGILYELSPRFGHSMVPDKFSSVTRTRSEELQMSETFFSPATMKGAGFMDGLVRGMAQQGSQLWDSSFVEDIRNHLFESSPGRGGLDLVAVNIQVATGKSKYISDNNYWFCSAGETTGCRGTTSTRKSARGRRRRTSATSRGSWTQRTLGNFSQVMRTSLFRHIC